MEDPSLNHQGSPCDENFEGWLSCCCSSVIKLYPTLCYPMDCSTPGSPVLHHLPEFAQNSSPLNVMLLNHCILCHSLLLLSSVFPSIKVFSNESVLHIRWPKYWSFSFSISPSNEYSGLISFRMDWFDLLDVQGSSTTIWKHQFFVAQNSLWSNSHIHALLLEKP